MSGHLKKLQNSSNNSSEDRDSKCVELEPLRQNIAELERGQVNKKEPLKRIVNNNEPYRNLVENSQDLMFLCDRYGHLIFVNKAWEKALGFTVNELMHRKIFDLQAPDVAQKDIKFFSKRLLNAPINGYETTLISRTGTNVYFSFNIIGLLDLDGRVTGAQGTAYNISERKKMEEEYLRIQKLESIGTLAGGIAHDFNNLLQAILGNIQLAKRSLNPEDKPFSWLTSAEKASEQAKDLSYRLLTFARGGEPFRQITSITKLLRDTVQLTLAGSNISVDFFLDENLYPLEIDEGQIKQAISNIVINAKEVMPKGGHLTVNAHNVLAREFDTICAKEKNYVHISIEDQGIGITPNNVSRVFDPYFTTKGVGSEKGKGLGLTICHSIIKRHDGIIRIDSTPGIKTIVHIFLPEADTPHQSAQSSPVVSEQRKERILLMDDEHFVRDVTSEMLEQLGYEVQLAKDGDEAIEIYCKSQDEGKSFDAVILDLTIPGGTGGDEAILKLIDIDPNIKGILSSGYADNNIVNDFREFGFKGVISKPFNFEELANVVASVIGRPT